MPTGDPGSWSESRLGTGKLSPELLRGLVLGRLGAPRGETLVGAALGIDGAVVAADGDWAWVLTVDPITTASAGTGRLAVHVVCNDLAAMGAEPVGVLATLLFPSGVSGSVISELTADIDATARALNVEVLGGHTEIAPGVTAPLVVMSGIGKARRDRVLTAAGARPGDALVLTKAAALEGTHVLAADFFERLLGLGVSADLLRAGRAYGEELSVLPEARLAANLGATAMHDPTEGGVLGALWEMAEASGCGFRVAVDAIPVRAPSRAICDALGVDPLRLIASGALLIACRDATEMLAGLRNGGIEATQIGVMSNGPKLLTHPDGQAEELAPPNRDELYRLLDER